MFERNENEKQEDISPLSKSGFKFLTAIDSSERWRLAVDGRFQGFIDFENREKNSIRNFLKANLLAEDFINGQLPLDKDLYKKIHTICRVGIEELVDVPPGKFITKNPHGFPTYHLSADGLSDLSAFARKYPNISPSFMGSQGIQIPFASSILIKSWIDTMLKLGKEHEQQNILYIVDVEEEKSEKIVQDIFNKCNQFLKQARSDNEIIAVITDCAYELEHLHPYKDVNLRTIMVIVNLLLMKHGFPPVLYFDPNYIDGLSRAEFADILKQGMLKTLDVIEQPGKTHYGFSSANLNAEDKARYQEIIAPIDEALQKFEFKVTKEELAEVRQRILALKKEKEPKLILNHKTFDPQVAQKYDAFQYATDSLFLTRSFDRTGSSSSLERASSRDSVKALYHSGGSLYSSGSGSLGSGIFSSLTHSGSIERHPRGRSDSLGSGRGSFIDLGRGRSDSVGSGSYVFNRLTHSGSYEGSPIGLNKLVHSGSYEGSPIGLNKLVHSGSYEKTPAVFFPQSASPTFGRKATSGNVPANVDYDNDTLGVYKEAIAEYVTGGLAQGHDAQTIVDKITELGDPHKELVPGSGITLTHLAAESGASDAIINALEALKIGYSKR